MLLQDSQSPQTFGTGGGGRGHEDAEVQVS